MDINLIPDAYQAKADDPEVVAARVDQIASDYPDLDYLLCFQSEGIQKEPKQWDAWRRIFKGFYAGPEGPVVRYAIGSGRLGTEPRVDRPIPGRRDLRPDLGLQRRL